MESNAISLIQVGFEPWDCKASRKLDYGEFNFCIVFNPGNDQGDSNGLRELDASFVDSLNRCWGLLSVVENEKQDSFCSSEFELVFGLNDLIEEPQDLVEHSVLSVRFKTNGSLETFVFDIYHDGAFGDLIWNLTLTKSEAIDAR